MTHVLDDMGIAEAQQLLDETPGVQPGDYAQAVAMLGLQQMVQNYGPSCDFRGWSIEDIVGAIVALRRDTEALCGGTVH